MGSQSRTKTRPNPRPASVTARGSSSSLVPMVCVSQRKTRFWIKGSSGSGGAWVPALLPPPGLQQLKVYWFLAADNTTEVATIESQVRETRLLTSCFGAKSHRQQVALSKSSTSSSSPLDLDLFFLFKEVTVSRFKSGAQRIF